MQPHASRTKDWWQGRTVAFGTMHGKERLVAPILEERLGVTLLVPEGFDSDRFGTFTREVERAGSQLEAARAKARAAMAATGADLGLASEGSFNPDPHVPFLTRAQELIVLIDSVQGLELIGHHATTDITARGQFISTVDEALTLAKAWGFPEQGVLFRNSPTTTKNIEKDFPSLSALEAALTSRLRRPFTRRLHLETDLRAHQNPSRQAAIIAATQRLAEVALTPCPQCSTPGFSVTDVRTGLPCGWCGNPTERVRAEALTCQKCHHSEERATATTTADPADCQFCNP
jgi:hypothetical protein